MTDDEDATVDVFVYGTLTDPDRAASVCPSAEFAGPATLHGLHREAGRFPTLAPGGRVDGRILRTDDVTTLDRYEELDAGLYVRVTVPRADGNGTVETYVGDPEALDAPVEWPGEASFPAAVSAYLDDADVTVSFK